MVKVGVEGGDEGGGGELKNGGKEAQKITSFMYGHATESSCTDVLQKLR